MKINFTVLYLLLCLLLIGTLTWRYIYIVKPSQDANSHLHELFPLDSHTAEYYLSKFGEENYYQITYYKNGRNNSDPNNPTEVIGELVGSSQVNLDNYLDKKIRITGKSYEVIPICTRCEPTGQPVLKIDSIELAE